MCYFEFYELLQQINQTQGGNHQSTAGGSEAQVTIQTLDWHLKCGGVAGDSSLMGLSP